MVRLVSLVSLREGAAASGQDWLVLKMHSSGMNLRSGRAFGEARRRSGETLRAVGRREGEDDRASDDALRGLPGTAPRQAGRAHAGREVRTNQDNASGLRRCDRWPRGRYGPASLAGGR